MKKEIDISREIGRANWMAVAAGEAVTLGRVTHQPDLTNAGTNLSRKLSEVGYNDDGFGRVQGEAEAIEKWVERTKMEYGGTMFIDEICTYRGKEKSCIDWEYDLIYSDGRYQINMIMPEFTGQAPPNQGSLEIESCLDLAVQAQSKIALCEHIKEFDMGSQRFVAREYFREEKIMMRKVEFNHECGWKRGVIKVFYFDDFSRADQAWKEVRVISGRAR